MRDPKRIPRMLILLWKIWEKHPDLRLGQIVVNATQGMAGIDPFYLEDEDFMEAYSDEFEV